MKNKYRITFENLKKFMYGSSDIQIKIVENQLNQGEIPIVKNQSDSFGIFGGFYKLVPHNGFFSVYKVDY